MAPKIAPTYDSIFGNFNLNNVDPAQTRQEIMDLYQMDLSRTDVRNIIGSQIAHPERFMRSSSQQKQARRLMEQMRNNIADDLVSRAMISSQMNSNFPGSSTYLERCAAFYRQDHGDGADAYNEALAAAAQAKDPARVAKLMYQEITRLLNKFEIKGPQDIAKLYTLTDQQLTENYGEAKRLPYLVTEVLNGNASRFQPSFEPDALAHIQQFDQMQFLFSDVRQRIDTIANPLYADYDPALLFDKGIGPTAIENTIADSFDDPDASRHPVTAFFAQMGFQHAFFATDGILLLESLNPDLKGAVFQNDNGSALLMSNKPLMAYGTDNEQYVVTNNATANKILTAEEYTDNLIARATKADRWLLTGSKQFDQMLLALKALNEAQADGLKGEQLKPLVTRLEKAAKAYLEYKIADFTEYMGPTSLQGKNQREQNRLEVAGDILAYAQSQAEMLPKVIAREAAREQAAKDRVAPQKEALDKNTASLNFLKDLPEATKKALNRQVHQDEVKVQTTVNGKPTQESQWKPRMPQEQFSALCALACGSDKVHTNTIKYEENEKGEFVTKPQLVWKKGADGKLHEVLEDKRVKKLVEELNPDPAGTFKIAIQAIAEGPDVVKALPDGVMKNMFNAAMSNTFHALKNNNYDTLGKMVADGLKMNNDMMQNQKGFTRDFWVGANLIDSALKAMNGENNPLRAAVEKHLDPAQLQTAKALNALKDVYSEGLLAQRSVLNFLASPNKDLDNPKLKEDLAKICNMYGTSAQFAGKKLDLMKLDPKTYPQQIKNQSAALAQEPKVQEFINDLKAKSPTEQFNAVTSYSQMNKLFKDAILDAKQHVDQQNLQNQPVFTYQLQAAPSMQQNPSQPAPQPAPQAPSNPFG